MKLILIILVLFIVGCSNTENKTIDKIGIEEQSLNSSNEELAEIYEVSEVNDEYGKRVYIDSSHFHIVRRWFDNGNLYIEYISDLNIKTESTKEYYENGLLKQEGLIICNYHDPIGIWKYYSINGELDSIVDFDIAHQISYYNAIEISKELGFEMPHIEIFKVKANDKTYWQINSLLEEENGNGHSSQSIAIDCETGEVETFDRMTIGVN